MEGGDDQPENPTKPLKTLYILNNNAFLHRERTWSDTSLPDGW